MPKIIKNLIKRLIYFSSQTNLFKSYLDKYKNNSVIFCLHRVLPKHKKIKEKSKNLDFIITTNYFENFIREIKKEYEFVDLKTLVKKSSFHNLKKYCHLTFDDGYIDNLYHALPILKKYNIPATFYIADSYANKSEDINNFLCASNINAFMNWKELQTLCKSRLVTIGCHTSRHKELSKLNNEEIYNEIFFSKKIIEKKIKKKIYDFAYPYGGTNNFNNKSVEIVKKLKFKTAVTTLCNKWNNSHSAYLIPRYFVTEKCSKMILRSRINGLSNFLKNQFLL